MKNPFQLEAKNKVFVLKHGAIGPRTLNEQVGDGFIVRVHARLSDWVPLDSITPGDRHSTPKEIGSKTI